MIEAKAKIVEIKLPQAVNKGKKRIVKLKTSSTLLLTKGKGEDEEVEDEEKLEEEKPLKKKGKIIITKPTKPSIAVLTKRSLRKKSEKEGEKDEEELEKEETLKKNGKVIITKPTKPSTIVFTRRSSRKKDNKEGGDIIFKKHPPTFQERLKELEAGAV